jgi:hypothetical protein
MLDSLGPSNERQQLVDSLTCPLNWNAVCPEHELRHWFRFAWYVVALGKQIDKEVTSLISHNDFEPDTYLITELGGEEVSVNLLRVRRWYADAAKDYLNRFVRLYYMKAASSEVYDKHYIRKDIPAPDARRASALSEVSLLHSSMSVDVQLQLFWGALNELLIVEFRSISSFDAIEDPSGVKKEFARLFDHPKLAFAVDFRRPVGATEGDTANHALFDVDFSTAQFHMYPISVAKYRITKFKCEVKGWDYGLR